MDEENKKKLRSAVDYLNTAYNIYRRDIHPMAFSASECALDFTWRKVLSVVDELESHPEPDFFPSQQEKDREEMVADMSEVADAVDKLRSAVLVMIDAQKTVKKCMDLINKHID